MIPSPVEFSPYKSYLLCNIALISGSIIILKDCDNIDKKCKAVAHMQWSSHKYILSHIVLALAPKHLLLFKSSMICLLCEAVVDSYICFYLIETSETQHGMCVSYKKMRIFLVIWYWIVTKRFLHMHRTIITIVFRLNLVCKAVYYAFYIFFVGITHPGNLNDTLIPLGKCCHSYMLQEFAHVIGEI